MPPAGQSDSLPAVWEEYEAPPQVPQATAGDPVTAGGIRRLEDTAMELDAALGDRGADCSWSSAGSGPLASLVQAIGRERQELLGMMEEQLRRLEARQQLCLGRHMRQVSEALRISSPPAAETTHNRSDAPRLRATFSVPELPNGGSLGSVRFSETYHRQRGPPPEGVLVEMPSARHKANKIREAKALQVCANQVPPSWSQQPLWQARLSDSRQDTHSFAASKDEAMRQAVREEMQQMVEWGSMSQALAAQTEMLVSQGAKISDLAKSVETAVKRPPVLTDARHTERSPRASAERSPRQTPQSAVKLHEDECGGYRRSSGSHGSDVSHAQTDATHQTGVTSCRTHHRSATQDWRSAVNFSSDLVYLSQQLRRVVDTLQPGCSRKMLNGLSEMFDGWLTAVEPDRKGRLADIVNSWKFESICLVVITINALFAGLALDEEMRLAVGTESMWFGVSNPAWLITFVESGFLCFYMVELALRLAVHGRYFFCNHNVCWNVFDLMLVVIGAVDVVVTWVSLLGEDIFAGGGVPFFMRILRIVKVGRILRGLRAIRFLDELRLMLHCMVTSVVQLFWALAFISVTLYIFGLVFMVGAVSHLQAFPEDAKSVVAFFGTFWRSGLSLFQATTGGMDWVEIFIVVESFGWMQMLIFLFYIFFFLVAILNIITSAFLDRVLKLAEPSPSAIVKEKNRNEMLDRKELEDLFHAMDVDSSGTVSLSEFMACLPTQEFGLFLATRGIDIKEARAFFQMIAAGKTGDEEVNISDLVSSCMRIKGVASSLDLHMLRFEFRQHQQNIERALNLRTGRKSFGTFPRFPSPPKGAKLAARGIQEHHP